ncbi:MAG: hypothetical protein HJJLKODD_01543 [Phycisphaerae bacterium]|nr:hypothetical protein [Phycisphaerae bacterium]
MIRVQLQPAKTSSLWTVALERTRLDAADDLQAQINQRTFDFELLKTEPAGGVMRLHGQVQRYYVWRDGSRIQVWLAGRIYELDIVESRAQRAGAAEQAGGPRDRLTAPMPGTIRQIKIQVGDSVEPHQTLLMMESMKMESALAVGHAARVIEICCQVGQLVQMNETLIKLEPLAS